MLITIFATLTLLITGVDSKRLVFRKKKFTSKTKYPTRKTKYPTSYPTNVPTNYPTYETDISNCIQWTCEQWCYLFDETKIDEYSSYGCVDDGDDICICD